MRSGSSRESSLIVGVILRILDIFFIVASARIAYNFYFDSWNVPEHYRLAYTAAALSVITLFPVFGAYRLDRGKSRLDDFGRAAFSLSSLFLLLALAAVLSKTSQSYSRVWYVLWFSLSLVTFCSNRLVFQLLLRFLRTKGYDKKCVVLVGTVDQINRVYSVLEKSVWTGLRVEKVFLLDGEDEKLLDSAMVSAGNLNDFEQMSMGLSVNEIWLCLPINRADQLQSLLNELSHTAATVRYVPDFFGFDLINHSVSQVGELPVVNLSVTPMEGWNRVLKWLEDKLLSLVILILVSPLMLALALGVKLSSPGPVFYRQERVGWNGRRFNMLKFRSMPVDNEKEGIQWGNARHKEITAFGRFIRATSLDELPQFINVLKGDMSIVGPRPERTVFVSQFKDEIPRYMQKHIVKAGITGWAQVNGWRGDTDLNKRVEHDMYYIENWSLVLDIKIILLTLFKGFVHKNAR
ncbi:MAG: undecaprenyl-phosphate glucose phosphotransferase [Reinekea sp.]